MDLRVKNTIIYIEDNLDVPFNLKSLSEIACLSPSQFHRVFKKETNMTPFQFVEDVKMNKAYEMLIEGDVSIQVLSINLGYKDYETFSRAFKRRFKLPPDDFKSISMRLKTDADEVEKKEIIIAPVDFVGEEELAKKLRELIDGHNISLEHLLESKIFRISKKSNEVGNAACLVKNKYEMMEDEKLWKLLIEEH